MAEQLKRQRDLPVRVPAYCDPEPVVEQAPGRETAGQWTPAAKRLLARYQRKGDRAGIGRLMKVLHERGTKDAA